MAFVYKHRRNDTGEVFYIGIGYLVRRLTSKQNRNKHWHHIVNKVGFTVEVVIDDIDFEEAKKMEVYLISLYGRRDLKTGTLVNMTDGGDGCLGQVVTLEQREYISKRTKEGMKKVDLTGPNNPMWHKKFTEEHRRKISIKSSGRPNVMKGKKNPKTGIHIRKLVIDTITGEEYPSATDAAIAVGMNRYTLIGMLNGHGNNKTSLLYLCDYLKLVA